jgi:hypothetical protein
LGESGSIVVRQDQPAYASPKRKEMDDDLMRLIGSAQQKADRLMRMCRNQL